MNKREKAKPEYVPYPRAMRLLQERLGATPAELAVWVTFGDKPGCGGIAAYLEANKSDNPERMDFDCWSTDDFDYVGPLMGAWFLARDVAKFKPASRYIKYPRLVERWSEYGQLEDVEAYILAKVREDRLAEIHPVTASSELGWRDRDFQRPAKETTLLDMDDVERVEREDEITPNVNETPGQRKERLQMWQEEEQSKSLRGAVNRVAQREDVSRQRIEQILGRE